LKEPLNLSRIGGIFYTLLNLNSRFLNTSTKVSPMNHFFSPGSVTPDGPATNLSRDRDVDAEILADCLLGSGAFIESYKAVVYKNGMGSTASGFLYTFYRYGAVNSTRGSTQNLILVPNKASDSCNILIYKVGHNLVRHITANHQPQSCKAITFPKKE